MNHGWTRIHTDEKKEKGQGKARFSMLFPACAFVRVNPPRYAPPSVLDVLFGALCVSVVDFKGR